MATVWRHRLSAANDRNGLLSAVGAGDRHGLRGAAGVIDDRRSRRRRQGLAFIEARRISVRPIPGDIELVGEIVIVVSVARQHRRELSITLAIPIPWAPERASDQRPEMADMACVE